MTVLWILFLNSALLIASQKPEGYTFRLMIHYNCKNGPPREGHRGKSENVWLSLRDVGVAGSLGPFTFAILTYILKLLIRNTVGPRSTEPWSTEFTLSNQNIHDYGVNSDNKLVGKVSSNSARWIWTITLPANPCLGKMCVFFVNMVLILNHCAVLLEFENTFTFFVLYSFVGM